MIVGYECTEHGFQNEYELSENGERVCIQCGMEVTGIKTIDLIDELSNNQTREFTVRTYTDLTQVTATDYEKAFAKARTALKRDEPVIEITRTPN